MVAKRVAELEQELVRLGDDLDRYQAATHAALECLDAAIGHLERDRRTSLAREMRRNRAAIVDRLRDD